MENTNSNRIIEEGSIDRVRETVSPRIHVEWDPVTNDGTVIFELRDQVWESGEYMGLQKQTRLRRTGPGDSITQSIPDIVGSWVVVDGVEYPGTLMMAMIKGYFELLWQQRYANEQRELEAEVELPPVSE